jgi:hypothetical protein
LKLVTELLSGSYPLKHLRRVQGILRLHQTKRVTREALEYATKMALIYSRPQFPYVQATAEYFDKNGLRPTIVRSAPKREQSLLYLHNPKDEERIDD